MSDNPDLQIRIIKSEMYALIRFLGCIEFRDEECQHSRRIRVGEVVIIEDVGSVPEIGIQTDDLETPWSDVGIGAIVGCCILGSGVVDPSIL